MAKKEFTFHGKNVEEIKNMSLNEFMEFIPSRERRSLKKGFTEEQKIFLNNVKKGSNKLKTHCRDLVIIPDLLDKQISVHNGKEFVRLQIVPEMLGHRLGEFALSRKSITHSSPGVGATKSSANLSVK